MEAKPHKNQKQPSPRRRGPRQSPRHVTSKVHQIRMSIRGGNAWGGWASVCFFWDPCLQQQETSHVCLLRRAAGIRSCGETSSPRRHHSLLGFQHSWALTRPHTSSKGSQKRGRFGREITQLRGSSRAENPKHPHHL